MQRNMHDPASLSHLRQIRPSQTAWDLRWRTSCLLYVHLYRSGRGTQSLQSTPYWLDSTCTEEGLNRVGAIMVQQKNTRDLSGDWDISAEGLGSKGSQKGSQKAVGCWSCGNPSTRRNGVRQKTIFCHYCNCEFHRIYNVFHLINATSPKCTI